MIPTAIGIQTPMWRPIVKVSEFELRLAMIQMIQPAIQFGGLPSDDPNTHLAKFMELKTKEYLTWLTNFSPHP